MAEQETLQDAAAKTKRQTVPPKEQKTHLQQLLDEYSSDIKKMTNIKKKQFDTTQVASMINKIPERKWNAAKTYIDTTANKKEAENKLKSVRAAKQLRASKYKDSLGLSNAEDRKAWVDSCKEVEDAEIELINAECEMLAAKMGYECLDDLFTAGKKIMGWLIDEDKSQREYNEYANEGRKHQ